MSNSEGMLNTPVVDKSAALDLIFGFLHLAQRRGAYSFPESAKIFECIQQFNDFFEQRHPPEEEEKDLEPLKNPDELGEFEDKEESITDNE